MTIEEKENLIVSWGFPWTELVETKRRVREDKLRDEELSASDVLDLDVEYEHFLDRCLKSGKR